LDLTKRGPLFEHYARRELRESAISIAKPALPQEVSPNAVEFTIGNQTEELDLVWRFGQVIVVGEVKCNVHATTPLERRRLRDNLAMGADQVSRKVDFVRTHPSGWPQLQVGIDCSFNGVFVGVVITNLPTCSGFPINGVPVVDLHLIQRYMKSGTLGRFSMINDDGTTSSYLSTTMYNTAREAQERLVGYLHAPPQIHDLIPSVVACRERIPVFEPERPMAFERYSVQLSRLPSK